MEHWTCVGGLVVGLAQIVFIFLCSMNVSSWDERDFLSSPSFGSGIVRKGIYLMGVFLHSSEHWLVVMASVMTEIL